MKLRIKEMREKIGLSQKKCADEIGVTLRAWQNYEQGEREPKFESLCKIADLFGVTTDYLFGREPQTNPLANLNVKVDDEKFVELYSALPDYAKQIFVDTMAQLSQAMQKTTIRKSTTYTCGELEDLKAEEKNTSSDAG